MAYLEGEESSRTYVLNRNASVTVKSKMKGDVYTHKLVLTVEQASMEPLRFINKGEIAKLLQEADLEDAQTNLFGDEAEEEKN